MVNNKKCYNLENLFYKKDANKYDEFYDFTLISLTFYLSWFIPIYSSWLCN